MALFYSFTNLLNVWLYGRCGILIRASALSLLWDVVLAEGQENNPAPHRYVVGRGSIFNSFFRQQYSFILYQKLTNE